MRKIVLSMGMAGLVGCAVAPTDGGGGGLPAGGAPPSEAPIERRTEPQPVVPTLAPPVVPTLAPATPRPVWSTPTPSPMPTLIPTLMPVFPEPTTSP